MANGILAVPSPKKEGERAMEMTMDFINSGPTHHVVNIPNNGIIKNLPNDCIVEIPGRFKDGKMIPAVEPFELPAQVAELVRPHAEQTKYTVDAALGNSLELCVKAMQHDPMCRWIEDNEKIEALTKLMLYYEQKWLPESWKEWIPTKAELEKSKYWVAEKELKNINKVKFAPKAELKSKAFFWS
jgi:alpha-galactosidase